MRLIDVLKNCFYIDSEVDYEVILDALLNDISNDEIIGYEIDETDSMNKLVKIATEDGNVKEIRCTTTDNPVTFETDTISIYDDNTKITIHNDPFEINAYSNFEDYDKTIVISEENEDKLDVEMSVSNKYTNAGVDIQSHTRFITYRDKLDGIIELIENEPKNINEYAKKKALKK